MQGMAVRKRRVVQLCSAPALLQVCGSSLTLLNEQQHGIMQVCWAGVGASAYIGWWETARSPVSRMVRTLCAQHPEFWLKKALAVKNASLSLDAAAARAPGKDRGAQLPLLRAPDIEARAWLTCCLAASAPRL